MRFLIDAQLPVGLTRLFQEAGHEAVHVHEVGLLGARDNEIRSFAARGDMVVVTKDRDFVIMRQLSDRAPKVVWVRIVNTTNRMLAEKMRPIMREVLTALGEGEFIVEIR